KELTDEATQTLQEAAGWEEDARVTLKENMSDAELQLLRAKTNIDNASEELEQEKAFESGMWSGETWLVTAAYDFSLSSDQWSARLDDFNKATTYFTKMNIPTFSALDSLSTTYGNALDSIFHQN